MPKLPQNLPIMLYESLKKQILDRKNGKDLCRFMELTRTADKVFSPQYYQTIKSKHMNDNQIQALIKAGAFGSYVAPILYNSSQCRDVVLGGNWSLVGQILKSMEIIALFAADRTQSGDENSFNEYLKSLQGLKITNYKDIAIRLTNLSPFPLTYVVFVSNPITARTVYPMTSKSRILPGSKSNVALCLPLNSHLFVPPHSPNLITTQIRSDPLPDNPNQISQFDPFSESEFHCFSPESEDFDSNPV
jgi:hypothetical protein